MHNALKAACALRQRHAVQYVGAERRKKIDSDASEMVRREREVMGDHRITG
jgi:hypothetical protein